MGRGRGILLGRGVRKGGVSFWWSFGRGGGLPAFRLRYREEKVAREPTRIER